MIAQVLEDQKLALGARGISIDPQQTPLLQLLADREKLRVALDNLLSNAIKYSPENGRITIRSRAEHARGGSPRAVVEIIDQGPGIPAELAPSMFEPFVQGPAPSGSPVKGSGLGLAIVREYIGAQGGDVSLQPNHPQGTCARIRLPLSSIIRHDEQNPHHPARSQPGFVPLRPAVRPPMPTGARARSGKAPPRLRLRLVCYAAKLRGMSPAELSNEAETVQKAFNTRRNEDNRLRLALFHALAPPPLGDRSRALSLLDLPPGESERARAQPSARPALPAPAAGQPPPG